MINHQETKAWITLADGRTLEVLVKQVTTTPRPAFTSTIEHGMEVHWGAGDTEITIAGHILQEHDAPPELGNEVEEVNLPMHRMLTRRLRSRK